MYGFINRNMIINQNALILTLILAITGHFSSFAQNNALVWSDEFNYTGLPAAEKWSYDEGGHGWGNNEIQYYTKDRTENARVEDGHLIIEARRESYGGKDYTSARLVSRGKGDWLYGRVEVRARLQGGRGTWSAIWMLPTDWAYGSWPASGEIDIMEHVGYDPLKVYGTVHTDAYNHKLGTQKGSSISREDFESSFHVYAVEWTPERMDFFVDDFKYYTFVNEGSWQKWPFDKRFHLIMNIAVGGTWGGAQGIDANAFPQRMIVDYVRIFQKSDLKITGPAYLEPGQAAVFSATQFTDAAYDWQVPEDAVVTGGQGTSQIMVKWGTREGDVSVDVRKGTDVFTSANFIKLVTVPDDAIFFFGNLKDGLTPDLLPFTTDGSTYDFSESADGLRIIYSTVNPGTWPRFELTLPRPVNLKNHPWCFINLKTFNKSNSLTIRFDFADINGVETNATPVFRPLQIIADGQYHFYNRDFTGKWVSSTPVFGQKVDSTRIIKLTTYINGGIFGIANRTDSLWIESIRFQKSPTASAGEIGKSLPEIRLFPNPVNGRITIQTDDKIDKTEILNYAGTLLIQKRNTGSNELILDLTNLPPGIYILRAYTASGQVLTERFVRR